MALSREQLGALCFILFFFFVGILFKESILGESKEGLSEEQKLLALEKASKQNLNSKLKAEPKNPLFSQRVSKEEWIQVEIQGEVKKPGQYTLQKPSRYFELIQKAGGLTSRADQSRIKKNYFLKDGQVFFVAPKTDWIHVQIQGAIQKPGLYRVRKGTRYFQLIEKAGGLTQESDKSRVKKNYFLKDGQTFRVPFRKQTKNKTKVPLKQVQKK